MVSICFLSNICIVNDIWGHAWKGEKNLLRNTEKGKICFSTGGQSFSPHHLGGAASAGGGEAVTPDTIILIGLADCACTECEIKTHMFLFLMTLFHNQVLLYFFSLVNLWPMKVSRLTAEETDFINNTHQQSRHSPEYYNRFRAFMFHITNCIPMK